jgi:hypothetical protein
MGATVDPAIVIGVQPTEPENASGWSDRKWAVGVCVLNVFAAAFVCATWANLKDTEYDQQDLDQLQTISDRTVLLTAVLNSSVAQRPYCETISSGCMSLPRAPSCDSSPAWPPLGTAVKRTCATEHTCTAKICDTHCETFTSTQYCIKARAGCSLAVNTTGLDKRNCSYATQVCPQDQLGCCVLERVEQTTKPQCYENCYMGNDRSKYVGIRYVCVGCEVASYVWQVTREDSTVLSGHAVVPQLCEQKLKNDYLIDGKEFLLPQAYDYTKDVQRNVHGFPILEQIPPVPTKDQDTALAWWYTSWAVWGLVLAGSFCVGHRFGKISNRKCLRKLCDC